MSMGAGSGCDVQYLFAEDVLGSRAAISPVTRRVYRKFRSE